MKTIKGVIMNTETMEAWETKFYIDSQRVATGKRAAAVVSIGSEESNIQFTMRAYDLREAIRDR